MASIPGTCCHVRNACIRGELRDVWVQVEAKGVLPEVILIVKSVVGDSFSLAWYIAEIMVEAHLELALTLRWNTYPSSSLEAIFQRCLNFLEVVELQHVLSAAWRREIIVHGGLTLKMGGESAIRTIRPSSTTHPAISGANAQAAPFVPRSQFTIGLLPWGVKLPPSSAVGQLSLPFPASYLPSESFEAQVIASQSHFE